MLNSHFSNGLSILSRIVTWSLRRNSTLLQLQPRFSQYQLQQQRDGEICRKIKMATWAKHTERLLQVFKVLIWYITSKKWINYCYFMAFVATVTHYCI